MTPRLAEDIGIMVGDGNIGLFWSGGGLGNYEVAVTGNLITDYEYMKVFIKPLKYELFGLNFYFSTRLSIKVCRLRTYSKGLVSFYNKVIGLPLGTKGEIGIPEVIKKSGNDIKIAFIRGLADTDFSFTFKKRNKNTLYYPTIHIGTSSSKLVSETGQLLSELGYKPVMCYNMNRVHPKTGNVFVKHSLELNGVSNYESWVSNIGFSNPKNVLKYRIWKRNGYCLPNNDIEKNLMGPEGFSVPLETTVPAECSNSRVIRSP